MLERLDGGDPVHAPHDEVDEDDIRDLVAGGEVIDLAEGVDAVGGLADENHVVQFVEVGAQTSTHDLVIVDDENADGITGGHRWDDPLGGRSSCASRGGRGGGE